MLTTLFSCYAQGDHDEASPQQMQQICVSDSREERGRRVCDLAVFILALRDREHIHLCFMFMHHVDGGNVALDVLASTKLGKSTTPPPPPPSFFSEHL